MDPNSSSRKRKKIDGDEVQTPSKSGKNSDMSELIHEVTKIQNELASLMETLATKKEFDEWKGQWSSLRNSWRDKAPSIIPKPCSQEIGDCWAVAFHRQWRALVKQHNAVRPPLERIDIVNGVPRRFQTEDGSLLNLEDAIPFMESKYVEEMKVHRKPSDADGEDKFERLLDQLLSYGPVAVHTRAYPSYYLADDITSVFSPTELELQRLEYEDWEKHVGILTARCVDLSGSEPRPYWEFQESAGIELGESGFVKLASYQGLIISAVEMKV